MKDLEATNIIVSVKDPSKRRLELLDENGCSFIAHQGEYGYLFSLEDEGLHGQMLWDPLGRRVEFAPVIETVEKHIAPVFSSSETCDLFFVKRTDGKRSIARTVYYDGNGNSLASLDLSSEALADFSKISLELIGEDFAVEPLDFENTILEMWLDRLCENVYLGSKKEDWVLVSRVGRFTGGCRKWQFYNVKFQRFLKFQTFFFREDISRPAYSRGFCYWADCEYPPLFYEDPELGKTMSFELYGGNRIVTDERLFESIDSDTDIIPFYCWNK